jgi:hypothetical protein
VSFVFGLSSSYRVAIIASDPSGHTAVESFTVVKS